MRAGTYPRRDVEVEPFVNPLSRSHVVGIQYGEQRRVQGRLKKIDYTWRQLVLDCGIVDVDAVLRIE
ncbi:hypothetical protein [Selenomonas sp. WCT3]|uniref:hypothetical protein n=1 Tax=Selenomonas sp. WCT3 TaxID=3158785 RepID=UPI0015D66DBE